MRPSLGTLPTFLLATLLVMLPRTAASDAGVTSESIATLKQLEAQILSTTRTLSPRNAARLMPQGDDGRQVDVARLGNNAALMPGNVVINDPSLDAPGFGDGQTEPGLAAFGPYVLAAWNDGRGFHDPSLPSYVAYAYSIDGGHSFVQGGAPPTPPGGGIWTSDPVIAVNEKTGDFYFCALFDPSDNDHGVAVARAHFAGTTLVWSTPHVVRTIASGFEIEIDKPWIAADSLSGNVYVTYSRFTSAAPEDSILFSRSTDEGVTWSPGVTLSLLPSPATSSFVQGSRPVVGPDGEVYVVWQEIGTLDVQDYMKIRKSTDFGLTFAAEHKAAGFISNFGTGAPGFNRPQGIELPSIAVDRTSGPRRGHIYVAWNECVNFYDSPPDTLPVLSEGEPNDDPGSAQFFVPGDAINGSLASLGDFDYYRFDAVQGATYIFWSDRIPTPYTLRVLCTDGVTRLAFSGDQVNTPPNQGFIVWTCPNTDTYYLRIVNVGATVGSYRIRTGIDTPGGPLQRARDQRDVFVAESNDGAAWSTPVLAHPAEAPLYDDWLPEVAVGGNGLVYVQWYDFADLPPSCGGQSATTLARSEDGGATWLPPYAISDVRTDWTNTLSNIIPNQGDYMTLFANTTMLYPCWTDGRLGTPDIWTEALPVDIPTPALVSRFVAEPVGAGMRVSWVIEGADAFARVVLERADAEAGPWRAVDGGATRDGDTFAVVDATVEPGRAYWYRLSAVTRDGAAATFGPLQAQTTAAPSFALSSVTPNPARGAFAVEFTVATAARVQLALFDLQGREAATLANAHYAAGRHRVEWSGRDVAAGVYFLRCTAGKQTLTQRVAISR